MLEAIFGRKAITMNNVADTYIVLLMGVFKASFFVVLFPFQNQNEVSKAGVIISILQVCGFTMDIFRAHFCVELLVGRARVRGEVSQS